MKTRVVLSRSLSRRLALALCAGLACSALAFSPGGVRAEALSDNDFIELCKTAAPDEVRRALRNGANPNARYIEEGVHEYTPLMRAAINPHPEVVGVLLAAGADVNGADQYGGTALMEAASSQADIEVLKTLLAAGAKVEAKGFHGITPLMRATANENPEAIRALLDAGADVNARDDGGETALMKAASDNVEAVRALLAAGADVSARSKDGETALMKAASGGDAESVRALLSAGADPTLKDKQGSDALWHARHADHRFVSEEQTAEVIRALREGGKKPSARRR